MVFFLNKGQLFDFLIHPISNYKFWGNIFKIPYFTYTPIFPYTPGNQIVFTIMYPIFFLLLGAQLLSRLGSHPSKIFQHIITSFPPLAHT